MTTNTNNNQMKKHIFTTFLALICAAAALNAQVKVSGTVLDKDGAPVIGAGVVEQGTLNGTTTDKSRYGYSRYGYHYGYGYGYGYGGYTKED